MSAWVSHGDISKNEDDGDDQWRRRVHLLRRARDVCGLGSFRKAAHWWDDRFVVTVAVSIIVT